MKNYLIICLFAFPFLTNAQDIRLTEDKISYEDTTYPAFSIYLESGTKEVKKNLKDYMDDQHDVKLKGLGFLTNKDVLYAKKVKLEAVSNKKLDFFAKVVEEGDRTKLSFFGAYGYDVMISRAQDYNAYNKLRSTMVGFVNDYVPGYYTEQVEEAQEVVEDLREEKDDLKDDIADNKDDIQEKLEDIEKLRKENEDLANKLKETSSKLENSEKSLKSTKGELDKANSQLKKLGNDR